MGLLTSPKSARRQVSGYVTCGFAYTSPYTLTPGRPSPGRATLLRHPFSLPTTSLGRTINRISPEGLPGVMCLALLASALAHSRGYGNINPLSIDYACRPRLRSRLTLGGLAWPRNPWSFGGQGSHLPYRSSCLHSHSRPLHMPVTRLLHRRQDAPLPNNTRLLPRLRRCA